MMLPLAEFGKIDCPTNKIKTGYIIAVNIHIIKVILIALKASRIIDIIRGGDFSFNL
jgi:hypothetical protein